MRAQRCTVRLHHALPIDFCIWVLQQDGLQVAPYRHHAAMPGALQRAGLSPTVWQDWFDAVIARQQEIDRALIDTDLTTHPPTFDHLNPTAVVERTAPLHAPLHTLWHAYLHRGDERQRAKQQRSQGYGAILHRVSQQLHTMRLPDATTITLYTVTYPTATLYRRPPSALVVSLPDETGDASAYEAEILRGINQRIGHLGGDD